MKKIVSKTVNNFQKQLAENLLIRSKDSFAIALQLPMSESLMHLISGMRDILTTPNWKMVSPTLWFILQSLDLTDSSRNRFATVPPYSTSFDDLAKDAKKYNWETPDSVAKLKKFWEDYHGFPIDFNSLAVLDTASALKQNSTPQRQDQYLAGAPHT